MCTVRPNPLKRFLRDTRGATTVEYTLLVCLVLAGASPALGTLGRKVNAVFVAAIAQFGE